ncbi:hypothetical protein MBANPS3_001989 [Mucor bainieri]
MRQMFFEDRIDDQKYLGYLYGLKCSRNSTSVQALTAATSNLTLAISDESNSNTNNINNNAIKSNGK